MQKNTHLHNLIMEFLQSGERNIDKFTDGLIFFPNFPNELEHLCTMRFDDHEEGYEELCRNHVMVTCFPSGKWLDILRFVRGTGLDVNDDSWIQLVGFRSMLFFVCDGKVSFASTHDGFSHMALEIVNTMIGPNKNRWCHIALHKATAPSKMTAMCDLSLMECIKVIVADLPEKHRPHIMDI